MLEENGHALNMHVASILESISDGFSALDKNWRYIYVNRRTEEITGKKREDLLGKSRWDIFPEVRGTLFEQKLHEAMEQRKSIETEAFYASQNKWYNVRIQPIPEGICTFFTDISADKHASEEVQNLQHLLQESEQHLQLALHTAKLGSWDLHLATGLLTCNELCKANFGLPPHATFTYTMLTDMIIPEDRESMQQAVKKAIDNHTIYRIEYRIHWPDGSLHWLLASGRALYASNDEPERMLGTTLDITEYKLADQHKDDFISTISHELKTPMTSIKGFIQLLHKHFEKEGRQEPLHYLSRVEMQVNKLTRLINELLDFTRLQGDKVALIYENFDFYELVQEVVENLQPITHHQVSIESTALSADIVGDREHLAQVLLNLLTNAIKYSPRANRVHIKLTNHAQALVVSVQDFGIGIPRDQHDKIFERFYRVRNDKTKNFPGLGIGLYIAREIVQRHQGTIWVESEQDKGSKFSFTIPYPTQHL